MWFTIGISAEHWHCAFSLPYWVPGKNKAMSITRFDSLDRDGLDFLGLERLWKVGNPNEKPNFREPLRDGHVQSPLQHLLHYIRYSYKSILHGHANQASHWKSHVSLEGDKSWLQKKTSKTDIASRICSFKCNMQNGAEFLVWSSSMWWMFFVQKYR